ncbi:hypothetical protein FRC08_012164 [Ceratobasidium sp. 394]|nr:hypothetical protein FRC08_012164 [Ceratobasidium sp. 394]KAG9082854.1 hypothetical protein FS749_006525 [Ceratobasidium sp. UAMH 11750]
MIALTPEFASLLVAITASTVGAAPNPRLGDENRRFVVGVDVPGVAKVHLRPRTSTPNSRIFGRHHEHEQDVEKLADAKALYIQPPTSAAALGKDASHRVTPTNLLPEVAGRSLGDPIDRPDPNEEVHAEDAHTALVDHVAGIFAGKDDGGVLRRRAMFHVDSQYGPGLIITHAAPHGVQQISRALALHELDRRGLLDPLLPILGSIPGVGGIIQLVAGTLSDVLSGLPILGPILGGLILSPHKSASAENLGNESNPSPGQFFLDASSSRNASTIYIVDSGHPTSLALASQFNSTNTTSERIVSLQMAFVNATSGQVQAYCATFDNDSAGEQSALAAKPCITDGVTSVPHASQTFGWNPTSHAVRPMWNDEAGNRRKRAYVVQAGSSSADVASEGGEDKPESVVLVFKPFAAQAPTNGSSTEAASSGKDATGTGPEAPTAPAPKPAMAAIEDEDDGIPVFIAGVSSS